MIGTIVYIIGIVLCVMAVIEIAKLKGNTFKKLIAIILILVTSWVGLIVYYLFARQNMSKWVK